MAQRDERITISYARITHVSPAVSLKTLLLLVSYISLCAPLKCFTRSKWFETPSVCLIFMIFFLTQLCHSIN